jgi:hypothetical protein
MQENPNRTPQEPEEESNAAKLLRIRGGAEDKIHDEKEFITEYDKKKNFWYHNKWTIILVSIFAFAIIVFAAQTVGKTTPDASIMYVGPYMPEGNAASIEEAFGFVTEDYNGDGEAAFRFASIRCYNPSQLEAIRLEKDEKGNTMDDLTYSRLVQYNGEQKESFQRIIFLDEFVIWLLDPALYEEVRAVDGFLPLSEIFSADYEIPAAIDATGIRFMETEFARYYECFANLPEDTVLCIRRLSTAAGKSGKEAHAYSIEMFRAIVEFTVEE